MDKARRYNKGKTRYELIPSKPLHYLAEVYTKGAHKYNIYENEKGEKVLGKDIPLEEVGKYKLIDDASNNWRKGMSWLETLGSIQRHIEAFKSGEHIDPELGTRHLANAAWGLFTLMEYEKSYPQGDDRQMSFLKRPKIGLDIDEIICNFLGEWCRVHNLETPTSWKFDRNINDLFDKMEKDGTLNDFYLNLPTLLKPEDIPFEPHCYITSRRVSTEITEQWLAKNGFPASKVYTVAPNTSKVAVAKEAGIDIFVDDRFENFVELNAAGICTFLLDAPHNQRYDVGYKRIKSLKELT